MEWTNASKTIHSARQGVGYQSLGTTPKLLFELPDLTVLLLHLFSPSLQQLRVAVPATTATASSVSVSATDGSSGCPSVKLELKL